MDLMPMVSLMNSAAGYSPAAGPPPEGEAAALFSAVLLQSLGRPVTSADDVSADGSLAGATGRATESAVAALSSGVPPPAELSLEAADLMVMLQAQARHPVGMAQAVSKPTTRGAEEFNRPADSEGERKDAPSPLVSEVNLAVVLAGLAQTQPLPIHQSMAVGAGDNTTEGGEQAGSAADGLQIPSSTTKPSSGSVAALPGWAGAMQPGAASTSRTGQRGSGQGILAPTTVAAKARLHDIGGPVTATAAQPATTSIAPGAVPQTPAQPASRPVADAAYARQPTSGPGSPAQPEPAAQPEAAPTMSAGAQVATPEQSSGSRVAAAASHANRPAADAAPIRLNVSHASTPITAAGAQPATTSIAPGVVSQTPAKPTSRSAADAAYTHQPTSGPGSPAQPEPAAQPLAAPTMSAGAQVATPGARTSQVAAAASRVDQPAATSLAADAAAIQPNVGYASASATADTAQPAIATAPGAVSQAPTQTVSRPPVAAAASTYQPTSGPGSPAQPKPAAQPQAAPTMSAGAQVATPGSRTSQVAAAVSQTGQAAATPLAANAAAIRPNVGYASASATADSAQPATATVPRAVPPTPTQTVSRPPVANATSTYQPTSSPGSPAQPEPAAQPLAAPTMSAGAQVATPGTRTSQVAATIGQADRPAATSSAVNAAPIRPNASHVSTPVTAAAAQPTITTAPGAAPQTPAQTASRPATDATRAYQPTSGPGSPAQPEPAAQPLAAPTMSAGAQVATPGMRTSQVAATGGQVDQPAATSSTVNAATIRPNVSHVSTPITAAADQPVTASIASGAVPQAPTQTVSRPVAAATSTYQPTSGPGSPAQPDTAAQPLAAPIMSAGAQVAASGQPSVNRVATAAIGRASAPNTAVHTADSAPLQPNAGRASPPAGAVDQPATSSSAPEAASQTLAQPASRPAADAAYTHQPTSGPGSPAQPEPAAQPLAAPTTSAGAQVAAPGQPSGSRVAAVASHANAEPARPLAEDALETAAPLDQPQVGSTRSSTPNRPPTQSVPALSQPIGQGLRGYATQTPMVRTANADVSSSVQTAPAVAAEAPRSNQALTTGQQTMVTSSASRAVMGAASSAVRSDQAGQFATSEHGAVVSSAGAETGSPSFKMAQAGTDVATVRRFQPADRPIAVQGQSRVSNPLHAMAPTAETPQVAEEVSPAVLPAAGNADDLQGHPVAADQTPTGTTDVARPAAASTPQDMDEAVSRPVARPPGVAGQPAAPVTRLGGSTRDHVAGTPIDEQLSPVGVSFNRRAAEQPAVGQHGASAASTLPAAAHDDATAIDVTGQAAPVQAAEPIVSDGESRRPQRQDIAPPPAMAEQRPSPAVIAQAVSPSQGQSIAAQEVRPDRARGATSPQGSLANVSAAVNRPLAQAGAQGPATGQQGSGERSGARRETPFAKSQVGAVGATPATRSDGPTISPLTTPPSVQERAWGAEGEMIPETITRQLVDRLSMAVRRGDRECSLELYPQELGRVQAQLSFLDDKLTLHLRVETPQAHQTIHQALPELRQALGARGVSVAQCTVDLFGGQTASGQWQHPGSQAQSRQSGVWLPPSAVRSPQVARTASVRPQGLLDVMI